MADNADVRSVEQLERFGEATARFRSQLSKELENLHVEIRRLTLWITSEARNYWGDQLVLSRRKLSEAQDALTRCMSYVRESERRPCTDEKKRVRLAEDRRATCEQKVRLADAAASHWQREQTKNRSKTQRCQELAESDLLLALNQLNDQIAQLKTYAGLRTAAFSSTAPAPPPTEGPKNAGEPGGTPPEPLPPP
ncbi:hypothetical protein [Aureliella helgolandensis]|uniref:Chromosome partition protein Smc n=1 Tax=Aureliella helgolandensis TaxID=2527968 RepID=A0A518G6S6_9BACT|nr:hypothetical protein [Aureliella helgolandensis]QDV24292.1 hypothetical protein Q31a_26080 [Aureliella helgolandensis]